MASPRVTNVFKRHYYKTNTLSARVSASLTHRTASKGVPVITLPRISMQNPTMAKSEADYVNFSRKHRCEDCAMFKPPGECTLVKGDISPSGTCRFWEAKNRLG